MAYPEAKSTRQLGTEIDHLTGQLDRLTEEVVTLRREQRANLDCSNLELTTIKAFLAETHPDLQDRFRELSENVRLAVNPE